jgi:Putative transposase
VFTLQTIPAWEDDDRFAQVAKVAGFSLHAGVAAQAWERQKLERLCRYISRPAVSEKRLSLTPSGNIRYQLKTPYRDGTTHVIFEPIDFIAKLAALVPKPRVNLTRYHGVFAPNSKHRVDVTPAKRGKGRTRLASEDKTPQQHHQAMTWAQRLTNSTGLNLNGFSQPSGVSPRDGANKRVFNIDVSVCPKCGGEAKVIASIEDQAVIDKILRHLHAKGALLLPTDLLPEIRASPDSDWFA